MATERLDVPEVAVSRRVLRGDIQALRAVAVALVLVYHLWPTRLSGGFVGVDVFFVISGFLIGGHLLGELRHTGGIRLGAFWARRAKRLLPASLLVLLVVTIATLAVAPLSTRKGFLDEVVGSVFYVQNWVLADKSVDYLSLGDAVSPVQHYWSLSVEEQLYVALPLLLVLVALVARRTRLRARPLTVGVLAAAAGASLVWSVVNTSSDAPLAYFSTVTRAWEFLAGALLACLARTPSSAVRTTLGVLGIAAVAASSAVLDAGSPLPGYLALAPVGGAVLLLLAGDAGPTAWLGRLRPVTWLGDISYAVYLWHWPIIVLLPYALEEQLTGPQKLAIVAVSLGLGHVTTFFFELPVRMSPRLLGGRRRGLTVAGCALTASVLVAGSALAGGHVAEQQQERQYDDVQALVRDGDVRCLGPGAVDRRGVDCQDLGDLLVPPPSSVALDTYNRTECWSTFGVSDLHLCGVGSDDPDAPRVLAVGDSHNNLYLIAYEQLAARFGWHVDVAGRAGCSWGTRPQRGRSEAIAAECAAWKVALADHLAASDPYDVILTTSDAEGYLAVPDDGETAREATVAGLSEAWSAQVARGSAVVALLDYPHAVRDVVACVEEFEAEAATECDRSASEARPSFDAAEEAVARVPGAASVTVRDLMCRAGRCPPVIGNVVVYRNQDHLTNTFVRTLVPYLAQRIPRAIEQARDSAPDAS